MGVARGQGLSVGAAAGRRPLPGAGTVAKGRGRPQPVAKAGPGRPGEVAKGRERFRRGGRRPGSAAEGAGLQLQDGGGGASAEAGAAGGGRGRRELLGLRRGHHGAAGPHPAGDRGAEPAGVGAPGAVGALQGVRGGRSCLSGEDQGPAAQVLVHPQDAPGRQLLLPGVRLRPPRGAAGGRPGAAEVQGDLGAQQGRAGGPGLHRVHDRGLPQHVHGAHRAGGAAGAAPGAPGRLQRAQHVRLPGRLPAAAHVGLPAASPALLRAVPGGRPQHQGVLPAGGGAHVQGERPHPHHRAGAGAARARARGVHGPWRGRRHQPARFPRGLPAPRAPPLPARPLRHPLQVSGPCAAPPQPHGDTAAPGTCPASSEIPSRTRRPRGRGRGLWHEDLPPALPVARGSGPVHGDPSLSPPSPLSPWVIKCPLALKVALGLSWCPRRGGSGGGGGGSPRCHFATPGALGGPECPSVPFWGGFESNRGGKWGIWVEFALPGHLLPYPAVP